MGRARSATRGARLLAVVVLAFVGFACATKPKTPPPSTTPPTSNELAPRAFFWEAQAENGARLFLLGSVHIGDGRQLVLDARIEQDWAQTQELVVELDTTTLSPIDAVDATNRFGLLPRGTTLRSVVAPDTYKQVAKYMKARGYPMERIDRMRPWLVAQVVTQLEYTAAGLEAENGVDVAMMRRATGRKGIVPLESLEQQAALFAGLPAPMQETMLVEILREAQALLAVTRATLHAWEMGDEQTLNQLLFGNSDDDPALKEFYERVFYSRNRTMTDRLIELSADARPRFVVVGTGHLIGAQGIPQLLAQRGFRVERVGSARVLPGAGTTASEVPAPSATPVVPNIRLPGTPTVPSAPTAPATPSAPSQPVEPVVAPAISETVPAVPPPPILVVPPAPAMTAPPAPVAGSEPAPAPVAPAAPVAEPTTAPPVQRSPDVYDSWLGQDATTTSPPPAPPPQPALEVPAPVPVPAPKAAPAPPPVAPKAKSRPRTSSQKP